MRIANERRQLRVRGGQFHGALVKTAAKAHICTSCQRNIPARGIYIYFSSAPHPNAYWVTVKLCGHCQGSTPEGRAALAVADREEQRW